MAALKMKDPRAQSGDVGAPWRGEINSDLVDEIQHSLYTDIE